ncbi:MAG TPA: biopolymer transporter ExbD [Lacunisphaera sp.]|jgi:biopolymer transport protein ExbD|nr:biopolymer transporter ExbD [Lacunisphaera sp.]HQY06259.1 biopolymer transporter ExbD [Lacunisphaera sp.]
MHGGGGGTGPGGIKKARIEIIPLIDVIFFLLATFVLFTISLNKSNGISVKLPTAETSEVRDPNGTVTISVTDEGTVAWNKDLITLDEFTQRLLQFKQEQPDGRILINGDERAFFAQAIYVVDEARKAGFNRVFIETHVR